MLWLYMTAAGVGALLGLLWRRVIAVVAASAVLMTITVVVMTLRQRSLLEVVVNIPMLLTTLQLSYFAALMLTPHHRLIGETSLRRPSIANNPQGQLLSEGPRAQDVDEQPMMQPLAPTANPDR
jgi:hypothetical protein